jgi:hypothetical protein
MAALVHPITGVGGGVQDVAPGDSTITIGGTTADPTVEVAKTLDHTYITDWPVGFGGDLSYTFTQMSAQTHWHIVHNLGKHPDVVVVDSGGTTVFGDITYIDVNTVDLDFSAPFGGVAYLN